MFTINTFFLFLWQIENSLLCNILTTIFLLFRMGDWFFFGSKKMASGFSKIFLWFFFKKRVQCIIPLLFSYLSFNRSLFHYFAPKKLRLGAKLNTFWTMVFWFFLVFATEKLNSTLYTTLNSLSIYHKIRQNDFLVQNGFFGAKISYWNKFNI